MPVCAGCRSAVLPARQRGQRDYHDARDMTAGIGCGTTHSSWYRFTDPPWDVIDDDCLPIESVGAANRSRR